MMFESRFRIQDVQLVFQNSFAKVSICSIFYFLLKFVTLGNSQFSGLQKTKVHNKGINLNIFQKGLFIWMCNIYVYQQNFKAI